MSKQKRLTKKALLEDQEIYASLQGIADYNPSNKDYSLANVTASRTDMGASQTDEAQKLDAYEGAKDISTTKERDFHNMILGAKTQVKAQFGENSNEFQALGMKKKEEYKVGRRKTIPSGGEK